MPAVFIPLSLAGKSPKKNPGGFSLLEVLVSVTVLALMTVMIAQTVDALTRITVTSTKRMSVDNEARLVLNRIGQDFSSALKRPDIDYYFDKRPGNDQFALFSQSTGYFPMGVSGVTPTSPISLVGYRIENNEIQRLNKALVWNGVDTSSAGSGSATADNLIPMVFLPLTIASTWPDVTGTGNDPDYQTIGGNIFRMEFCFLLSDDSYSTTPWIRSNDSINGLEDVKAILITVAALDFRNRQISGNLSRIAAKLPDISGQNLTRLPASIWQNQIENGLAGVPEPVNAGIRIYQSFFFTR